MARKSNDYQILEPEINDSISSYSNDFKTEITRSNQEQTKLQHQFHIRFFFKPIFCAYCHDYIWGEGYCGYGCASCGKCVHSKCKIFVTQPANGNNQEVSVCDPTKSIALEAITRSNLYPIENWSIDIVKQWLAVVNLHRYAEVFATYKINGSKLLTLDIYQLYAFRIRDSYHHSAILQARDELIYKSKQCYSNYQQMLKEEEQSKIHLLKNPYKADHHHFLLHTISKLTDCDMCGRPLLGILHQCLRCQKCSLVVHRSCASTGLPACKPKNMQMVMSIKHHLFGVSLFDLYSNQIENDPHDLNSSTVETSTKSQVPLLLVKAFKNIEERAYNTFEDLYDVYRLSTDTCKIDEIKQQLNENGIELTKFEQYDLNTIAAIVKNFLRDLQDSVIPEEMYEKLINTIQTSTTNELRSFITNQLHPLHYSCLSFIMKHLIKVWNYQFKVRGCHYLPDKLFHIFRSILIRPPWDKIYQIVFNIDKQALVIQRLVLECDWGVDLPEYKIKPKRPISESLDYSNDFQKFNIVSRMQASLPLARNATLASDHEIENQEASLIDISWFWGNITRDDTILILKNCPDGSFLVRNSTEKNLNSPYTLCVMKGTLVKSIKIFRQDSGGSNFIYDIEKPCRFETVPALITYYSKVSLKEYNHNLDIVLTYGVSKYKFGKTTEWTIDKLYSSFRDASQQHEKWTKKFDGLELEISNIREDLNQKRTASNAFDKIINMYEEQIIQLNKTLTDNLLKKNSAISSTRVLASQLLPVAFSISNKSANYEVNEEESSKVEKIMNENKSKLKDRINDLIVKKEELKQDIDYLQTIVSQLQEELDLMRPELIELRKKRENYHMWLLQRGEKDENIQNVLKLNESVSQDQPVDEDLTSASKKGNANDSISQSQSVLSSISIHANSLNWYSADCEREKANEILEKRENGTYLVRLSTKPSFKYVLSVVIQNIVKHLPIEENQSGCFLKSAHKRLRHNELLSNNNSRTNSPTNSNKSSNDSLMKSSTSLGSISSINSIKTQQSDDSISTKDQTNQLDFTPKFKTLTELIVFYSENNVKIDNTCLDIKLTYPAFLGKS